MIALIVLGPQKLPEAARSLGKGFREMRDSFAGAADGNENLDRYPDDEDEEFGDEDVEDEDVKDEDEAYEPELENAILPQAADIERDLRALLAY